MATAVKEAHRHAMAAKEEIFRAQDALGAAWSSAVNAGEDPRGKSTALLRKLERRLAKVRRELEELDNEYLFTPRVARYGEGGA